MTSIKEIIGIDTGAVERLHEVGVSTLEQLLEQGATSTARMHLADQTGLDDASVKQWVHQADLMRVKGVGPELAHGSIRFSLGKYTTEEDVRYVAEKLPPIIARLRSMSTVSPQEAVGLTRR